MQNTVKERLEFFLKSKKISKTDFGKAVGVSNSFVSSMRKSLGPDKIQSIAQTYPDLNIEWLLTGEGEMLKTQSANNVITGDVSGNGNQFVAGNNNVLRDKEATYTAEPTAEDAEIIETLEAIPIVSIEQAKEPGLNVKELVLSGSKDVKTISWVEFIKKLAPFDAIYTTYTDRMSPLYVPGEFLFTKYLHPAEGETIMQGVYLIDTRQHGSFLCRLCDNLDGTLTASFDKCDNYAPITYKREDVTSIGEVAFSVRLGELTFDVANVADLKAQRQFKDEQIRILATQLDKQGDRANRLVDHIDRLVTIIEEKQRKKE